MSLHPQVEQLLAAMAAQGGKQIHEMTPEEAKALDLSPMGVALEDVACVEDRVFDGVPVRVYRPVLDKTLPALVYFHGGGYVIGGLHTSDRECRSLANQAGCVVVNVDYRLAPEHKYPAAVDDCFAATRYVATHAGELGIDPSRIAVGGDSAGGNLAAVVALRARDEGGPKLAFQLLIYPCCEANATGGTMEEHKDGPFLTAASMQFFYRHYYRSAEDRAHPYGSAGYAADFRGLPPAFVITAEYDPLRDQGENYARKLQQAGVAVAQKRYEGMIHPFFNLGGAVETAVEAIEDAAFELRMALSKGTHAGRA